MAKTWTKCMDVVRRTVLCKISLKEMMGFKVRLEDLKCWCSLKRNRKRTLSSEAWEGKGTFAEFLLSNAWHRRAIQADQTDLGSKTSIVQISMLEQGHEDHGGTAWLSCDLWELSLAASKTYRGGV